MNTTNTTNNNLCQFEGANLSRTLKIFAIFFVGGFGILNNVFIVILTLKYTTTKNLHHLIINMAVADVLTVLARIGLDIPPFLDGFIWGEIKAISGDIACQLLSYLGLFSMLVSYTTVGIITIERFRASRRTVRISQPYTKKQRLAVVVFSWLISAAHSSYEIPYTAIEEQFKGTYVCKVSSTMPAGLFIFECSTLYVAFCCIIVLSVVTLKRISYRHEIETSLPEVQRKARAKKISGAIKMVLSSLGLYSICSVSIAVWSFIIMFPKNDMGAKTSYCYDLNILGFLIAFLPLVNSCFGPVIYLIFLADFRKAAKRVLCRRSISQDNNSRSNFVVQQLSLNKLQIEQSSMSIREKSQSGDSFTTSL